MNKMVAASLKPETVLDCGLLLGVAESEIEHRLLHEIRRIAPPQPVTTVTNLDRLRESCAQAEPAVIVVDLQLFESAPLDKQLEEFIARAPVILFGGPKRQVEFAQLLANDRLDFVGRCGDFIPLVVNLLERRLRSSMISKVAPSASLPETAPDLATIFRHEINNPLTGILGNAELVLAHANQVSAVDKQRLQTVVDLAVRLRETIRRVSNSLENGHSSAQSA